MGKVYSYSSYGCGFNGLGDLLRDPVIRHSRKLTADGDFVGHVRCEKCGTEYTVKAGDFNKGFMSRYRRVTRTEVHGTAFVNRHYYSYYAKKFDCPCCGKRRYAQVLKHQ